MSGTYITRPGETFAGIMRKRYNIVDPIKLQKSLDTTQSLLLNSHLKIIGPYAPIRPYEVITFPDNFEKQESAIILPMQAYRTTAQFKNMPQQDKEVLAQLDTETDWQTAEAITEWAKEYGFLDFSGDANTGAGTAIGIAAQKATPFVDKLKQLDTALLEYRNVAYKAGAAKQAAKAKVLNLHKQLNQQFGKEIEKIVLRKKKTPGRSPFINAQRALNKARSGRAPVNLMGTAGMQSMSTFAKYAKPVGKGLVVLDTGIRGWKIYDAKQQGQDWYRELAIQSGGLLGASVVGYVAAGVAAMLALGPFGLIIIFVIGVSTAIAMDYVGQQAGGYIYDSSRRLY